MAYSNSLLSDYANLRTLPALTSAALIALSAQLYQAIPQLTLNWFNFTVSNQGALLGSLLIYVIAFASSETKSLEYYENWEMALISSGPGLMLLYQYIPYVQDQFAANSPTFSMIAFAFSVVSWGVMVK